MKICLYLEFYYFLGGILFKGIGTGLLSSYKNQKVMLDYLGIPFTEKWDDSCDILQINTPWLKSIYLIKKAKRRGKKVIIWSHVIAEEIPSVFWFGSIIAPLAKKYLAYAYGLADLVLCPSEYTKSLLAASYGLSQEKLVIQSNGVDLKLFFKDEKRRIAYRAQYDYNGLVIGTVALAVPRKGIDTFLELAKNYPQYQFIWFGKIYSKLMAKSLPKNLPKNVRFTGYVNDINATFNAIDIFLFPSYLEQQGMVILEAAAVGLPILVRDIPVYEGWLVHGENCLKAKNNGEFQMYLKQLIRDGGLRRKLGQNAKILAKKESIEVLSEKLKKEYVKILRD